MKTLLEILNEQSISAGFQNFNDATNRGRVYLIEHIIDEAGKQFLKQYQ
jgi:hypothetical protein